MQWIARLSRWPVVASVACLLIWGIFIANAPAEHGNAPLSPQLASPVARCCARRARNGIAGRARSMGMGRERLVPARRCARAHWVRAEYLAWWMPGAQSPPLITTSNDPSLLGNIGADETIVLFGGGPIQRDWNHGFRLRMGKWLDCEQTRGLEASFFMVCPGSQSARAGSSDGSLIVGRPFIDANTGNPELSWSATPDWTVLSTCGLIPRCWAPKSCTGTSLCCERHY
jgi:hypothetical protein